MNITITLILDKGKNQYIRGKMGVKKVTKEINQCQEKWLKHVQRMDTNRLPKQALQYKRKGRRNIRRPRKRWSEQFHLEKTVPGKVATNLQRMDTNKLPKEALKYKPKGRRYIRRPRKRWRDQLHLEKKVQGKVATTCTGWTQTDCQNKHYNINQKEEGT